MIAQTVLVIDDESAIRRLTRRILSGRGFQVLTADSVATAEELLLQNHVDLVLCDHHMPGENGLSFLGRIGEQYSHMVRTLVTGNAEIAYALESGEDDRVHHCLSKPYEMRELANFVSGLLDTEDRRQRGDAQTIREGAKPAPSASSRELESALLSEGESALDWEGPSIGKDDRRNALDRDDIALNGDVTRLIGS